MTSPAGSRGAGVVPGSATGGLSGVLSIIVAALMLARWRPRGWAATGWIALASFGAFSIAGSLSGMDCAPCSGTTCALRKRAGKLSFAHQLHAVTNTLVVRTGIVGLVVAHRAGPARPRREYMTVAGGEIVRRPCLGPACRDRS